MDETQERWGTDKQPHEDVKCTKEKELTVCQGYEEVFIVRYHIGRFQVTEQNPFATKATVSTTRIVSLCVALIKELQHHPVFHITDVFMSLTLFMFFQ